MAYLRIHCENCGGTWEIYHRDDWKTDKAMQCPHCFAKIERSTWTHDILPAFSAVQEANAELFKDHTGYHDPLFTFDVIADHLYQNRQTYGGKCPVYDDVKEILDSNNIRELIEFYERYNDDDDDPYNDEPADDDRPERWKNCPNLD